MSKYVIEFIGTFFLVLVIASTGNPLAIAAILIAMIYMGGYISGAHYNPAVTLAVFVRGKISPLQAVMYWIVQILGALCAALIFAWVASQKFNPGPNPLATFQHAVLMEFLFTFALATVVLHVATSVQNTGNSYFGLAIGMVILAGAYTGGLSGGVYNPAVALGAYLSDFSNFGSHMANLRIYLLGPLSGGLCAGILYRFLTMPPKSDRKKSAR